jgi:integrating conjugative element protein (TIGR03758 family)
MTAAQLSAFQANSGFTPSDTAALLLGSVFATFLLWSAWALKTAYTGWAEQRLNQRQFLVVLLRVVVMYLVLTLLLLS